MDIFMAWVGAAAIEAVVVSSGPVVAVGVAASGRQGRADTMGDFSREEPAARGKLSTLMATQLRGSAAMTRRA